MMIDMAKTYFDYHFRYKEEGAGMVEYALLVALIGVMLIVAIGALRGGIEVTFGKATKELGGTAS